MSGYVMVSADGYHEKYFLLYTNKQSCRITISPLSLAATSKPLPNLFLPPKLTSHRPWNESQWTASDDRVRGGSSISHLTVQPPSQALFHGHLDTKTLGGAGFASQRTRGVLSLDLSRTAGLKLDIGGGGSEHKFTLTVKDTIPEERRHDGRDQAGVSWEVDFEAPKDGGVLDIPWDKFRATYRGRDIDDPKPLDLGSVKRVSLMMRR